MVLCFLTNFPSTTFQRVCLNAAIRRKIHLPCRIGHNKCLRKTIFSRTFMVLNVFSSSSQKAPHYLITYCVPLSLQNCSRCNYSRAASTCTLPALCLACGLPSLQLLRLVLVLALILSRGGSVLPADLLGQ